MPALQRAVAVAEDRHFPLAVAEGLDLHVSRPGHAALHEQAGVAELRLRETQHRGETACQLGCVLAALHADATPAGRALQHHGVADGFRRRQGVVQPPENSAPRQQRHAGLPGKRPGLVLQSEPANVLRAGSDEDNAVRLKGGGEVRVLAQEPVAGMHRLGAADGDDLEQPLGIEIGLLHATGTERIRLPRRLDVHRVPIRIGVNRDALDAHGIERARDAHRDLAAVGDEDLAEHGAYPAPDQAASEIGVGL